MLPPGPRRRRLLWTLEIATEHRADAILVRVAGRLGAPTADALQEALRHALEPHPRHLLVDCAEVDYVSSAGVGVLERAAAEARAAGGRLVLCGLQEAVRMSFELSGLADGFTVADTPEQALAGTAVSSS